MGLPSERPPPRRDFRAPGVFPNASILPQRANFWCVQILLFDAPGAGKLSRFCPLVPSARETISAQTGGMLVLNFQGRVCALQEARLPGGPQVPKPATGCAAGGTRPSLQLRAPTGGCCFPLVRRSSCFVLGLSRREGRCIHGAIISVAFSSKSLTFFLKRKCIQKGSFRSPPEMKNQWYLQ